MLKVWIRYIKDESLMNSENLFSAFEECKN